MSDKLDLECHKKIFLISSQAYRKNKREREREKTSLILKFIGPFAP